MAVTVDLSYKFASLVKQLHESPDNFALKQAIISIIPEMTVLAKVNPLAQYRLAQIHSPSSPQYKQMMRQSANKGCTNAMLAICENLLKSAPSPADLKTAAYFMQMIGRSKDTYILEKSNVLLESKPALVALMKVEFKTDSYNTNFRFFTSQPQKAILPEPDVENTLSL